MAEVIPNQQVVYSNLTEMIQVIQLQVLNHLKQRQKEAHLIK